MAGRTGPVPGDSLHNAQLPAGRTYRLQQRTGRRAADPVGAPLCQPAAAATVRAAVRPRPVSPGNRQPGPASARPGAALADRTDPADRPALITRQPHKAFLY